MGRPGRVDSHIRGQPSPDEGAIAQLAARQHGVVARRQLRRLGFTRDALDGRVARGHLHSVHRGVYAVGHRRLTARGHWMAAILACGAKSMLSHRPAGAIWNLLAYEGRRIDVIAPRSRGSRPGIHLHRVHHLHPADRSTIDGIPVTSVSRTLLDLAEVVRTNLLERAFEAADRLNLLDLIAIDELLSRCLQHRGRGALVDVLGKHRVPFMARSELERLFLELCRDAGLPLPLLNVIIEGFEVDAVWPEHKLVVELDSVEFHQTRAAFERDRIRDAALQLAEYRVIRITYRRLKNEPEAVVATLLALLTQTNT